MPKEIVSWSSSELEFTSTPPVLPSGFQVHLSTGTLGKAHRLPWCKTTEPARVAFFKAKWKGNYFEAQEYLNIRCLWPCGLQWVAPSVFWRIIIYFFKFFIIFFCPICNVKSKSCHGLSVKCVGEEWLVTKPFTVLVLRASASPNTG